MILRIIAVALVLSLCCCSKKPTAPLVGSVSFSANGTAYSWTEQTGGAAADYLTMDIYPGAAGSFHLNITNGFSGNLLPARIVFITFYTTTLTLNTPFTYTNPAPVNPIYPPHQVAVATITGNDLAHLYNASETGDFATLTITNLHGDMADGNFNAKLSRASDLSVVTISNGTFKNIKITP